MANNTYLNTSYSLGQGPLTTMAPNPIVSKRVPQGSDIGYQLGTLWTVPSVPSAYVLVKVASGVATWLLLESSGGSGVFSSLVVTPGPTSITGTTGINTAGAGVTTINTGGTGALNLGNATGNTAVTGTLTASGNIVSTAGNVEGVGAVASGDNAGLAATTSLTNVSAPVTSGSGTGFVVTPITGTATTASTGFIKLYLGTTAIFVPYWLATS